jgi:large subunit ribosomal protein L7/L12
MADFAEDIKGLGDKIVALTVGQAVQLGKYLEEVHGIKPAAGGGGVMMAAAPVAAAEKPAEQTEFTVVLEGLADPAKKIGVIKVVRESAGLGLAEAKAFVEGAPKNVKEGLQKPEAEALKKKIEEAGGKVAIK